MQKDPFTGGETFLEGPRLPGGEAWAGILDRHGQRLRALDQVGAKAAQCAFGTHQDRPLVLAQGDDVGLLELAEPRWAELGDAIRAFRATLPLVRLEDFARFRHCKRGAVGLRQLAHLLDFAVPQTRLF